MKGLYEQDPRANPDSNLLRRIDVITPDIVNMAGEPGQFGSGGMVTKIDAARIAVESGCDMVLASGVDDHPTKAVLDGGSLLPVGVVDIVGDFARGDAVSISDRSGQEIARGLSACTANEARRITGLRSRGLSAALGFNGPDELIHRDDLVLASAKLD